MSDEAEDTQTYQVVVNHEEQYSIWPVDRELPAGWRAEGTTGPKEQCLAHIDEVWTDMRPLSLRKAMEEAEREAASGGASAGSEAQNAEDAEEPEESLVSRLSRGDHPVEVTLRPERTGDALREAVERGYVFIKFTGTRGGTELGVRLDRDACDLAGADYATPSGQITLVGDLVLDFEPVRCTAEVDLATMTGTGRLSVREATS